MTSEEIRKKTLRKRNDQYDQYFSSLQDKINEAMKKVQKKKEDYEKKNGKVPDEEFLDIEEEKEEKLEKQENDGMEID